MTSSNNNEPEFLSDINDYIVFVDKDLWEKMKNGDAEAKEQLRDFIDGLKLYFHIFHPKETDIAVSIDELIKYDIVNSITIHKDIQ